MLISVIIVTITVFLALLATMIHGDFMANAFQYSLGSDDQIHGHTPPPPVTN